MWKVMFYIIQKYIYNAVYIFYLRYIQMRTHMHKNVD